MKLLTRTGTLLVIVALLFLASMPAFAQVSTSKTSISYGSVVATTTKTDSFYVKSTVPLQLNSVTTSTSHFVVLDNPGGIIFDSVKVRISFAPTAVGTLVDTVVLSHSGSTVPVKVALSGTGLSPIVLGSPRTGATLTTLAMVDTFATHPRLDSLTIRNTSKSSMTVTGLSFTSAKFTVLTATPFTVGAADSQRVRIQYMGTGVMRDLDTLAVTHNLPITNSSPIKLGVRARSVSRLQFALGTDAGVPVVRNRVYDNFDTLRVTATSTGTANLSTLDPKVPVDSARAGLVSLWNTGDSVWVRVDSMRFAGPNFTSTTPTPFVHRPGGAYDRNLTFIFKPKSLSDRIRDTLILYTDDNIPGGNRLTLLVEGGSRRAAYVRNTLKGVSLTFGTVGLGASLDSTIRIYNYQDIQLRIDSIRFALKNPKYSIGSQTDGFVINRGDSAAANIRFTASDTVSTNSSGNHLDTVLVYSDFSATPLRLPLTAKVTSTIVYLPSATTVGFGTLTVGLFKDSTIKVYNRTTTNYRFDSLSLYSGKDYYLLSNSLVTQLKAGDSTLIQIRYKPLTAGFSRDTLYIWHNFAPLITNPRKVVLTGTGSTNALISPSNYVTVDNVNGPEGYAISAPDSSYVETTINGFYNNLGTTSWGGGTRRSPNLSGSPSGSTARWTIKIDSTAPYLIYHYVFGSGNNGSGYYVHLRKFGVGGIVDSMRYDERLNWTTYPPEAVNGSWLPLMMHRIDGVGPNAASITIGADNQSSTFMRTDAIRFLRSSQKADLEFGRRSLNFNPIRIPEEYGQVTIGTEYLRQYRLYNLGRDTLTISNMKVYPTLTPVPWFYVKDYTGAPIKVPPMTAGNDGKETGGYYDLPLALSPYQEGSARDSLVITSNDENEPNAYIILYGEGLGVNFIMNASSGNTEPHYNAPGPPDVPVRSIYRESPGWLNSAASTFPVPISGTNSSSRVNVGGPTTLPHQAWYEFQLPEIFQGRPTDGRYILEYMGANFSSNAYSNTLVKVTHTFGVPPDSVNFDSRTANLPAPAIIQIGGTAKTWFLAPGGQITVEFRRDAQTEAAGGIGFLRTDLLRIRKVPSGALLGVNIAQGASISFGDVSFRQPAGIDGKANKKEITLGSRGESQIVVRSIQFRDGRYFKLAGAPPLPLYLRALIGDQKLTLTFTPDRISPSFIDTLEVLSNSVNRDSVLLIPVVGNGIGGIFYVDDDGSTQEVSSTPAFGGLFLNGWDKTKMNNWQVETSNTPDSIGRGKTRRVLPIYFNGRAQFEWYPAIAQTPGEPDSILVNVAVTIPRGFGKVAPRARYKVFSTGGNITKDTLINQNSGVTTGASNLVELNLGNHWFLRGGRDIAGGQAFFGHVRLENDTAAVSAFYGTTTNFARRDTFALVADALVLRELDRLQPTVTGVKDEIPLQFALSQNYPNPFNPTTTIEFSLARSVPVELKVYDLLGREVAVLINGDAMNPGRYMMRWDGRNRYGQSVATGVYFYRLVAGDFVQSKKMVLVK
ncbi:MAG TPA: hypothetical protein DEP53_10165 [Bacteroidetes bacterium]|nr:hypothetical protein [Bacteroidota bacterium]